MEQASDLSHTNVEAMENIKTVPSSDNSSMKSMQVAEYKDARNVKIFKLVRTVLLVTSWISMGMCSSIIGPTQLDLQERLGCHITIEDMSMALSGRNIGIILGSTIFAILNDRFRKHCDGIIATSLLLYGVSASLKPWANELWLLGLLYCIEGFAHGSQNVVGNSMILMTWGKDANLPMHALHFGYGVGSTIGPLVAMPFLSTDSLCGVSNNNITENSTTVLYPTTDSNQQDESQIEIAYVILGSIAIALSIMFYIVYVIKPPRKFVIQGDVSTNLKEVCSPGRCAGGATGFAVLMLGLISGFWFMYSGRNKMMVNYLFTYAVESSLAFDKDEAALLTSAYGAAGMVGRGIVIPISHYVSIQIILFFEVYGCAVMAGCLAFLGTTDQIYLWIFACLYAAFESVIYPAGVTWLDKYIMVVSLTIAVLDVSANVGGICFQLSAGYFFTYTNPDNMLYLAFFVGLVMCLYVIIMQFVASKHGSRFNVSTLKTTSSIETSNENLDTSEIECPDEVLNNLDFSLFEKDEVKYARGSIAETEITRL